MESENADISDSHSITTPHNPNQEPPRLELQCLVTANPVRKSKPKPTNTTHIPEWLKPYMLHSISSSRDAAKRYATTSDPENPYPCLYCKQRFPSTQALGGHQTAHRNGRVVTRKAIKASSNVRQKLQVRRKLQSLAPKPPHSSSLQANVYPNLHARLEQWPQSKYDQMMLATQSYNFRNGGGVPSLPLMPSMFHTMGNNGQAMNMAVSLGQVKGQEMMDLNLKLVRTEEPIDLTLHL
ncbi:hypothetical protein AMTRI_Chr03g138590 [Amborella trichopoda]|uniref:C2H2-type domain-containing protein n=1 Tax=Amborella trichopoda TaxID=13333 RepID=W1PU32_AMBTC|nr:hypothetical protein AMTR_s00022p00165870 [Amborella trichopoda]